MRNRVVRGTWPGAGDRGHKLTRSSKLLGAMCRWSMRRGAAGARLGRHLSGQADGLHAAQHAGLQVGVQLAALAEGGLGWGALGCGGVCGGGDGGGVCVEWGVAGGVVVVMGVLLQASVLAQGGACVAEQRSSSKSTASAPPPVLWVQNTAGTHAHGPFIHPACLGPSRNPPCTAAHSPDVCLGLQQLLICVLLLAGGGRVGVRHALRTRVE